MATHIAVAPPPVLGPAGSLERRALRPPPSQSTVRGTEATAVFAGNPPLYQHAKRGHKGAPGAEESLRDPTPERPQQAEVSAPLRAR